MDGNSRSRLGCGAVMILVGGWLLAVRLFPALGDWVEISFAWPMFVIGAGVLLLLFGVLVNEPGMSVPAAIVGGIGSLLYWQNATGNWESWAYAWTLIPGFVAVGIVLMGLWKGGEAESLRGGGILLIISLVLFTIFGSFLGGPNLLGPYWPVLLILLGLLILGRSLLGGRGGSATGS